MTKKDNEVVASLVTEAVPMLRERGPPVKSYLGGVTGKKFDDGSKRKIRSIAVKSGGIIDSIAVCYNDGSYVTHGGQDGYEEQQMEFLPNEYVIKASVWLCIYDDQYVVHGLRFHTNLDRVMGPCGKEKEWGERKDVHWKEVTITAPEGYGLMGIFGRESRYLNAIGYNWCEIENEE